MKNPLIFIVALLATLLLTACASGRIPGVYRIDIQQGNILTPDRVRQLSPGMEKRQVRFLLGTPLIVDAFDPDRWNYLYSLKPARGKQTQQTVSLYFDNDRLVRVAGDVGAMESDQELTATSQKVVTVPDQYRDRGVFGLVARLLGMDGRGSQARSSPDPLPEGRRTEAIDEFEEELPSHW